MLEEEVLDKVACLPVVLRIHCHLSEEVFHLRVDDSKYAEAVPEVVKGEKSLGSCLAALIFRCYKASAKLDRIWKVVLDELV